MTEIQDNREFIVYRIGSGQEVASVYKVDGKFYTGKRYTYIRCTVCGRWICPMMGGANRHYKMHKKNPKQTA